MNSLHKHTTNLLRTLFFLFFAFHLGAFVLDADAQGIKINSLSEIQNKAREGADTITTVAKYVLGSVLAIALVFVIYSLATNNPHAKDYLLGWVVAVVVIMVAFMII